MRPVLILLLLAGLPSPARPWESRSGNGGASSVAIDAEGHVVAAGFTEGASGRNFALAKFRGADGSELWRKTVKGTADGEIDGAGPLALDTSRGRIVAGGSLTNDTTARDLAVVGFSNTDGRELWRYVLDGSHEPRPSDGVEQEGARGVAFDSEGNVLVAGELTDEGGTRFVVAKISGADGMEVWQRRVGAPARGSARAVTTDRAGNVIAAGALVGTPEGQIDARLHFTVVKLSGLDGTEEWRAIAPSSEGGRANAVAIAPDGNIFAAGYTNADAEPEDANLTVVKLSPSGQLEWRRDISGTLVDGRQDAALAVVADSDGDVVAAGSTENAGSGRDFTVVKLSGADGTTNWMRVLDFGAFGVAVDVALDPDGDAIAVGTSYTAETAYDFTAIKFARGDGELKWQRTIAGPDMAPDQAGTVATDTAGNVVVGGRLGLGLREPQDFTVVKLSGSNGADFVCVNGTLEPAEECDDGNLVEGDGCDSNCTLSACGNGIVAGDEQCDDRNQIDGDGCDSSCKQTRCGNGIVTAGEQCDDGDLDSGDGCDENCTPTRCGNGIVTEGEECDDANAPSGDGCDSNCTVTRCGNGIVAGAELCDDANPVSGDGCDANCTRTACGNGVVTMGEQCDDANLVNGDGCDSNCTQTRCGNGIVTQGEQCDDRNLVDGDGCDSNCRPTGCGNGIKTGAEQCDDGDLVNGDGCDSNCTTTRCGNGVRTAPEECDDRNAVDADGCDSNCTVTRCGNGVLTSGEGCDDGNGINGDGCDSNCTVTACGNGVITNGEECDDRNLRDGDGCDSNCTRTECGNGIRTGTEECDDGDRISGDGCDVNCTETRCGNGVAAGSEQCDDANRVSEDGCENDCTLSPTRTPTSSRTVTHTGTPTRTRTPTTTHTATATGTPAPSATATPRVVQVNLGSKVGAPGDTVDLTVSLVSSGLEVAATANEILYPTDLFAIDPRDCKVNPTTGKSLVGSVIDTTPTVTTVRFFVQSSVDSEAIPDGPLFRCPVSIAASTLPGIYGLENRNPRAFSPNGSELPHVAGRSATIRVSLVPVSCTGDCNGDGEVMINEVITGVNIGLDAAPVSTCPAFDVNEDGGVTVNEVVTAVNNGLFGCLL